MDNLRGLSLNDSMSVTSDSDRSVDAMDVALSDHTSTPASSVRSFVALPVVLGQNGVAIEFDEDMSDAETGSSVSYRTHDPTELELNYTYDRDECVAAVRDFYVFLVQMFAPEGSIKESPEGGWPIPLDKVLAMGKTEVVHDLLCHLPYMDPGVHFHFQFETWNWKNAISNDQYNEDSLRVMTEEYGYGDGAYIVPSDVIGFSCRGRDVGAMMIDTTHGVMYWTECGDTIRSKPFNNIDDDSTRFGMSPHQWWRDNSGPWTFSDFFEILKDELRQLRIIPAWDGGDFGDVWENDKGEYGHIVAWFRAHGWPDLLKYRKDECMAGLETVEEEEQREAADS